MDPAPNYRELDVARIQGTIDALGRRIGERFPGSGLGRVADELREVVGEARATAEFIGTPHWPIRLSVLLAVLLIVAAGIGVVASLDSRVQLFSSIAEFLQGLEAAINEFVFLGIAIFFLTTIETRIKRKRALNALHVLRSMAHIVDMHQLTKDPERVAGRGSDTQSSPNRTMTPFELVRYLDYCSEMLAILSKVAALYVQNFNDPPTLSAVNDVEDLTNGLSRKIWQKIMILDRVNVSP